MQPFHIKSLHCNGSKQPLGARAIARWNAVACCSAIPCTSTQIQMMLYTASSLIMLFSLAVNLLWLFPHANVHVPEIKVTLSVTLLHHLSTEHLASFMGRSRSRSNERQRRSRREHRQREIHCWLL
jgi:hypothetical protein